MDVPGMETQKYNPCAVTLGGDSTTKSTGWACSARISVIKVSRCIWITWDRTHRADVAYVHLLSIGWVIAYTWYGDANDGHLGTRTDLDKWSSRSSRFRKVNISSPCRPTTRARNSSRYGEISLTILGVEIVIMYMKRKPRLLICWTLGFLYSIVSRGSFGWHARLYPGGRLRSMSVCSCVDRAGTIVSGVWPVWGCQYWSLPRELLKVLTSIPMFKAVMVFHPNLRVSAAFQVKNNGLRWPQAIVLHPIRLSTCTRLAFSRDLLCS